MSKKSRKRNKKILAALALAGGAAMLAKGRGKGTGAVSTAGQAVGVDRITPPSKYIQKKVVPDAVESAAVTDSVPIGRMAGVGTDAQKIANQKKRALYAQVATAKANAPKGVIGPMGYTQPFGGAKPDRFGRINAKGGGIAKRGKGAAYKSGGRVKSMGIAKRGGGVAKR